ncbi:NYN domain-containing protein [Lacticaseibacillus nasuensis]|uniref:NYN domain-containing protein n=1 Tax=Lacticaseibacillus nasuensis TaxID=944671 RepID=UPI0022465B67|nr:NYN domain-containing protein [Lacticaseibacillus nasuensis]MCX2455252.1 NYN domain-containing protein [Lacticaseibacillus nasuensis]
MRRHILIVDAYNVIGNWPNLAKLKAAGHLDAARDSLLRTLAEYRAHEQADMIVVFDAMYVPGITQKYDQWDMRIVWTQQDQTADSYIERLAQEYNTPLNQLTVVTSDQAEQWTVFSRGALRISSREFGQEIRRSQREFDRDTHTRVSTQPTRNNPWDDTQLRQLRRIQRHLTRGNSGHRHCESDQHQRLE